uniref:Uncharacterized protein n=1 Tax=viral metagenome TaxID=1070528 RepID=A0A6M3LYH8_9ZZZZ
MTITINGKNWIAQSLGVDNCFVPSGISWTYYATDGETLNESGGTAQLVARLTLSTTDKIIITSPQVNVTYTYDDMKTANGGEDITLTDALVIKEEDGDPSTETQFCYTTGVTPPGEVKLFIEAENYTDIKSPMVIRKDYEASNGKYVVNPIGIDCVGWVKYNVDIPKSDTYKIMGRTKATSEGNPLSSHDTFNVSMAGKDTGFLYADNDTGKWGWNTAYSTIYLEAGLNELTISCRETGILLDVLMFTNVLEYVPTNDDISPIGSEPSDTMKIIIEAEKYTSIVPPMKIKEDPNASNGKYIVVPYGSSESGSANYRFTIPTSGSYKIIGRTKAGVVGSDPLSWHDSFYINLDEKQQIQLAANSTTEQWTWNNIYSYIYLEAGQHELIVSHKENETWLDVIMITNNLVYTPTSDDIMPPGESPVKEEKKEPGEYEFLPPPSGLPSIYLFIGNIEMSQDKIDWHFKMDNVSITNTSIHPIYVVFHVKLFEGRIGSCPATGYVFDGLDRTATSKTVRFIQLDSDEVSEVDLDFYQPINIQGIHTVCLYVHGAWTKADVEEEVNYIGG